VEIDEAGSNHETRHVDHCAAAKRLAAQRHHATVADAQVAGGVESRGGVHDAAAGEDQIEVLRDDDRGRRRNYEEDEQKPD
jgi:hypothetical protein